VGTMAESEHYRYRQDDHSRPRRGNGRKSGPTDALLAARAVGSPLKFTVLGFSQILARAA
jgi:hypothetical protein